jgi:hypothetical protein
VKPFTRRNEKNAINLLNDETLSKKDSVVN